ncbi:sulfate ABC transporter permease [Pseudocolwellia agarivorans]|uniref:sulfate ABC transporter permease n=1 Tax=Pseudocolwellia agarivorans TaxID=1911682 RepID=UPI000984C390|nr:sulfate ABC transporter permease [Pseudocolwellia agarivorans]
MSKMLLALLILIMSFSSFAEIELTDQLSISGFGSTSLTKSNNQTAVIMNRVITDEVCWDCDTTFGLQLDYFNDAFKVSTQLVKRPQDKWSAPELEWAYVGYNVGEVEFRAGRLRIPIFLASEYYYVSHAYNYARPPEELYNSILGLTAYNGASVVWNVELFNEYQLAIMPFIGFNDTSLVDAGDKLDVELDIDSMSGINFLLSGEYYRWNLSYFTADFSQTFQFTNAKPDVPYFELSFLNDSVELYSLGLEYEFDSLLLTAERQIGNLRSTWYASAAYRLNKFVPYIQYGENRAKITSVSTYDDKSGSSFVMGLRYDLLYNVSLNIEWQKFKSFGEQRGSFVETPNKPEADLYTLMFNFVF